MRSLLLALLLAAFGFAAQAQSLDALRASGAVGERYDGYAVARESSAAGVVSQVNSQRRQIYEQRAAQQKAPVDQVGRVYAGEIFQKAPAGTWLQDASGKWVRK